MRRTERASGKSEHARGTWLLGFALAAASRTFGKRTQDEPSYADVDKDETCIVREPEDTRNGQQENVWRVELHFQKGRQHLTCAGSLRLLQNVIVLDGYAYITRRPSRARGKPMLLAGTSPPPSPSVAWEFVKNSNQEHQHAGRTAQHR